MLKLLGISAAAEKVYRAMLTQPSWTVPELVDRTSLPPGDVRQAVGRLTHLGLVRPSEQEADRLTLVSPSVALSALLGQAEAEAYSRRRQLAVARAVVAAITTEYDAMRDREQAVRHVGVDAMRTRVEELAATVRDEVVVLDPVTSGVSETDDAGRALEHMALERGVDVRRVCRDSVRNHPERWAYSCGLADLGADVRTAPLVPTFMIVSDRDVVLLPVDPAEHRSGLLELRSRSVVRAFRDFFEHVWTTATPLKVPAEPGDRGLRPLERALVQILASGATDEAAGRKLGLSLRTVRRMTADLMAHLGARSRFQAGVQAALRGWTEPAASIPAGSRATRSETRDRSL